ncbi:MAG: T9SS type A sorting domain-containing protein [Flavobacteriales bacterium]
MKTIFTTAALAVTLQNSSAQTAMNYSFMDCAGNPQEIYADLDAGKALILEFFMTSCSPCVTAGGVLETMKADLLAEFPGMIKAYAFGYSNSYNCATVNNWVSTNGFTSIASDSGAAQVAFYGGMGMPTIVILGGGTAHSVLGSPYIGFNTNDTTSMATNIRNFLNGTGINENTTTLTNLSVFPNPANADVNISIHLSASALVKIEMLDITGRLIQTVANENMQQGSVTKTVSTASFSEGNYLIRVTANDMVTQQKLNVVK